MKWKPFKQAECQFFQIYTFTGFVSVALSKQAASKTLFFDAHIFEVHICQHAQPLFGCGQVNTILHRLISFNPAWLEAIEDLPLRKGQVLVHLGIRSNYIFFPREGMVSVMVPTEGDDGGAEIQTAMLGRHDVVAAASLLANTPTTYRAEAHTDGLATRCSGVVARRMMSDCEQSRELLLRYNQAQLLTAWQLMACTAAHSVEQRIARWLLQAHACLESDTLPFTHVMVSSLTGIRRASVTMTIQALEKAGVVRQQRGRIDVVSLAGLRKASCGCGPMLEHQIVSI